MTASLEAVDDDWLGTLSAKHRHLVRRPRGRDDLMTASHQERNKPFADRARRSRKENSQVPSFLYESRLSGGSGFPVDSVPIEPILASFAEQIEENREHRIS